MKELKQNLNGAAAETEKPPLKTDHFECMKAMEKTSAEPAEGAYRGPSNQPLLPSSLNWGHGDAKDFLIFVAVVGIVVVAVLLVYSLGYLASAAYCGVESFQHIELGVSVSSIFDHSANQQRNGHLIGVKGSIGSLVPFGSMSLALEAGRFDLDWSLTRTGRFESLRGPYLLAGPRFVFPFFGTIQSTGASLELLAGTSTHADVGLMSILRLGLDFALSQNLFLGANGGAILLDLKSNEGFVNSRDQWNYTAGATLSWRF